MTPPVRTDRAAWTAEMSCRLERCTNALDDLRLLSVMNMAPGAFVMAVALCDGLVEQLEFVRAPVLADLPNLLLADKKAAAAWQLMRPNQR